MATMWIAPFLWVSDSSDSPFLWCYKRYFFYGVNFVNFPPFFKVSDLSDFSPFYGVGKVGFIRVQLIEIDRG